MDQTINFYVYQNGIVLGDFTISTIENGLRHGTFTENDWVWMASFKEWQLLGRVICTLPAKGRSNGGKGDTRVLPDLRLRPAAKVINKNVLSRSMKLKPRM